MNYDNIPVKSSVGGTYRYTDQDKKRIRAYRTKFAGSPLHQQFFADNQIKTAILNGYKLDDERL